MLLHFLPMLSRVLPPCMFSPAFFLRYISNLHRLLQHNASLQMALIVSFFSFAVLVKAEEVIAL